MHCVSLLTALAPQLHPEAQLLLHMLTKTSQVQLITQRSSGGSVFHHLLSPAPICGAPQTSTSDPIASLWVLSWAQHCSAPEDQFITAW